MLVKEADGSWIAFFSTDPSLAVDTTRAAVADRAAIEQDFHDVKQVRAANEQHVFHMHQRLHQTLANRGNLCRWLSSQRTMPIRKGRAGRATKPPIQSGNALIAASATKAVGVEDSGIEPLTSCMPCRRPRVPSGNLSEVTATADSRCTNGCTSETKKTRRSRSKTAPAAAPETVAQPPAGDFAAALAMIATLPLSDAEKAEAVRRLLKGRGE